MDYLEGEYNGREKQERYLESYQLVYRHFIAVLKHKKWKMHVEKIFQNFDRCDFLTKLTPIR